MPSSRRYKRRLLGQARHYGRQRHKQHGDRRRQRRDRGFDPMGLFDFIERHGRERGRD